MDPPTLKTKTSAHGGKSNNTQESGLYTTFGTWMIEPAEHQLRDQGDCSITLPKSFCLAYHQNCE